MKRKWVTFTLLSLALGVLLNIVVAWSLAVGIGVPTWQAPVVGFWGSGVRSWSRPVPDGWPERPDQWSREAWWCCTLTEHSAHLRAQRIMADGTIIQSQPLTGPPPGTDYTLNVVEWGWPMRTLDIAWSHSQSNLIAVSTFAPPTDIALRTGLPLPARFARAPWQSHLPLMPVWPGFVLNTLLYGVLAGVLLFGPRSLRKFLRHRRGLCLACGYDLAGLAVCPECGLPRSPGARAASVSATVPVPEP